MVALRGSHAGTLVAFCLDAFSPVALVASQFLYAIQPLLGGRTLRLAQFLESEDALTEFASYLMADDDQVLDPEAAVD